MATGWTKVGDEWFYLYSGGSMATGWLQEGSTWYYLRPSGVMAANDVVEIDGVAHIFDASGAWQGVYKEKPPVE